MAGTRRPTDSVAALANTLAGGLQRLGVPAPAPMVLAVSGGPDSMALLHAAAQAAAHGKAKAAGPDDRSPLLVGHLDHMLRPDSAGDATFVEKAASSLGLRYASERIDVRQLAAARHLSLEDAGRRARYAFLEQLAEAEGPDAVIVTAHTADDAAETVLLNLVRGSGLTGLRGIPARRGRVVRPFLGERRATLRAALDEAGIEYLTDPSNDDLGFARNRVRHELLPVLERLNPAAVGSLVRFARLAAEDDALLEALAAAEIAVRRGPDGSLDWRHPPDRALGRRVLRQLAGRPVPSAERIEALLDAAESGRGGLTVELAGGRRGKVAAHRIRLETD